MSQYIKCGRSKDSTPTIFPSFIGRPDSNSKLCQDFDFLIGDELTPLKNKLNICYPVENGIVRNWEDMELLYNYTWTKILKFNPKDSKILFTETPLCPLSYRKKLFEVMYEKFDFQYVQSHNQAVLSLYSIGILTGVSVELGDGAFYIVPVYDSIPIRNNIKCLHIGGRDITRYLLQLLKLKGYPFQRTIDFDIMNEIKEKYCYVAGDLNVELKLATETSNLDERFELPDGQSIKIGMERFQAPEALFQPHLLCLSSSGVDSMLFDAINRCDNDIRKKVTFFIFLFFFYFFYFLFFGIFYLNF